MHRLAVTLNSLNSVHNHIHIGIGKIVPLLLVKVSCIEKEYIPPDLLQWHHVSSVPDSQQVQVVSLGENVGDEDIGNGNITLVR